MSNKCYLKNQIGLVSLSSKDLFTYDEYDKYMEVISYSNEIDKIEQSENPEDKVRKKELVAKKRQASNELAKMIREHKGFPRKVRLDSVIYHKKGEEIPAGVTWRNLKLSKRIAEFESDMSRAMGLQTNDYTFDKIIVVWGSQKKKPRSGNGNDGLDLLEQIVMDGFTMDLLIDGRIVQKKYRYFTSSAGQLRTDKIQMISEDMWNLIKKRVECGMDWDTINARKGVNVSKLLAYLALECSASIPWPEFDINKIIVIPDFEATVTDRMLYIKPDYTVEDAIKTVLINHCDGAGMYLPDATIIPENVRDKNFMIRSNYVKGLLSPFDYIEFCKVHNVPPVIKDCYGMEHNLVTEDIQILLTESQFKFKKLFNSFDEYKEYYKSCGCQFVIAQFDEDWPPDKTMNYQFIQALTDFTDEELKEFTAYTHERLENLATDKDAMLRTLKADVKSYSKDKVALALYPELLRDGYNRQQLKDTKKRMLLDAKSGTIKCKNKRLYVIPDFYAACERWFLGEEHPKGLLEKDEIVCRPFMKYEKADVLRSPSLYMEHFIARINKDPEVYKWFISDGVVTSVHSLVSRILQLDCDGDQLNIVVDPTIVKVAERNIKEFDVIPLFYDPNKAPAELITKESIFSGLKRAHQFSNIGEISNMLTRLWNRDNPDRHAAALLTYLNNLRIDGAKTGAVNEYTNYPDVAKQINKATGGRSGLMPAWFANSKNGRRDKTTNVKKKRKWAKPNDSTMNRLCGMFDDIGNINMNWAEIEPFNWQMLLPGPCLYNRPEIAKEFCELDSIKISIAIQNAEESPAEKELENNNYILDEHITYMLTEKFGSLETCYPFIVKHLFVGDNFGKSANKQRFWRVFGDIAIDVLRKNLANCRTCPDCGAKIPNWAESHNCPKNEQGFYICEDCGTRCVRTNSRQKFCPDCQEHRRHDQKKIYRDKNKNRKEREREFSSFWQYRFKKM